MSTVMEMDNKIHELVEKSHKVTDSILELEKLAKKYYEESELAYHKNLFLIINEALCEAGHSIQRANIEVTGSLIQMYTKVLNEKIANGDE